MDSHLRGDGDIASGEQKRVQLLERRLSKPGPGQDIVFVGGSGGDQATKIAADLHILNLGAFHRSWGKGSADGHHIGLVWVDLQADHRPKPK